MRPKGSREIALAEMRSSPVVLTVAPGPLIVYLKLQKRPIGHKGAARTQTRDPAFVSKTALNLNEDAIVIVDPPVRAGRSRDAQPAIQQPVIPLVLGFEPICKVVGVHVPKRCRNWELPYRNRCDTTPSCRRCAGLRRRAWKASGNRERSSPSPAAPSKRAPRLSGYSGTARDRSRSRRTCDCCAPPRPCP